MKILIIGGTIFLGRRLVEAAVRAGHEVSIFHRGRHNLNDQRVEEILGDRHGDLSILRRRTWDAVIDTCGFTPGAIEKLVDVLHESVALYAFVSSVSVFEKYDVSGSDESAKLATIAPEHVKEAEQIATGERPMAQTYGEWYGALKALCEQAAERRMPGRTLIVRPGLIVGANDYSDRFTYWVRRLKRGGDVFAPGPPARRVRVIDARDLAEWMITAVEHRLTGVYNATGSEDRLDMKTMLDRIQRVCGSTVRLAWAGEGFIQQEGIQPWTELPLWIPAELNGIFEVANHKAIAAGLTFRSFDETIRDVLEWDMSRGDVPLRAGLDEERERVLLDRLAR